MGVAEPSVDGEVTVAVTICQVNLVAGVLPASIPPSRRRAWKANDYVFLPCRVSMWTELQPFDSMELDLEH